MEPVVSHCIHKCPPEPEQASPYLPITLLEDSFQYHFPFFTKVFQVVSFPHVFSQTLYALVISPTHVILDLITWIIFGEEYRWLSSSLCSLPHSSVTMSLSGPNILLRTLFSNTLSLHSSINVSGQSLHPYKTTGKIIVLYILIFKFLDSKLEDKRFCTKW